MKPIKFEEQTAVLHKPVSMTNKECGALPVWTNGEMCVSCWKLTFRERIKALFLGKIWLYVHSGEATQPPVSLQCGKTVFNRHGTKVKENE